MGRIADMDTVAAAVQQERAAGRTVVLTNGAFDLMHVGHVRYLQAAKEHGDCVVAAINSDASVRRAKGGGRPVVPELERAEMVAALTCVDWVVIFSEDTVARVIERLRPDVHAKGTDYTAQNVPEAPLVQAYGGRVVIAGDPKDHSTTALVGKLQRHGADDGRPARDARDAADTRMGSGAQGGRDSAGEGETREGGAVVHGVPVVVSAPSGAGKTTLCRRLMQRMGERVAFSVSHTTRAPRPYEKAGVDYHFVDAATFDRLVRDDAFLEWAHVFDQRYGTARAAVEAQLHAGVDVLFDIDVQGGRQIAQRLPDAVLIFVLPPDMATLEARLRGRRSETDEQIARRLAAAKAEISQAGFYHYWLVNDDLEQSAAQLMAILQAERVRRRDKQHMQQAFLRGERLA